MRVVRAAVVGMAMIVLAGCGGGDVGGTDAGGDTGTATESEDTATPSEDATADEEEPASGSDTAGREDAAVQLGETSLGDVLVDAEGLTLYMFDKDTEGISTCYEDCAVAWPPLLVEGEPAVGEGLDESLVTTVPRDDGTMQVKYGDWPLYYWKDDKAPGDVLGQAVGEVWWVVGADGQPIRTAPSAAPTS
jgi:predicted lipoprotein with Yx(FWY)xxD motif